MKNKIQFVAAIITFAVTQDILTSLLIGTAFWLWSFKDINIKFRK